MLNRAFTSKALVLMIPKKQPKACKKPTDKKLQLKVSRIACKRPSKRSNFRRACYVNKRCKAPCSFYSSIRKGMDLARVTPGTLLSSYVEKRYAACIPPGPFHLLHRLERFVLLKHHPISKYLMKAPSLHLMIADPSKAVLYYKSPYE